MELFFPFNFCTFALRETFTYFYFKVFARKNLSTVNCVNCVNLYCENTCIYTPLSFYFHSDLSNSSSCWYWMNICSFLTFASSPPFVFLTWVYTYVKRFHTIKREMFSEFVFVILKKIYIWHCLFYVKIYLNWFSFLFKLFTLIVSYRFILKIFSCFHWICIVTHSYASISTGHAFLTSFKRRGYQVYSTVLQKSKMNNVVLSLYTFYLVNVDMRGLESNFIWERKYFNVVT